MCSAGCTPGPAAHHLTLAPRGPPVAKQPARVPCKQLKQQDSRADLSGRGLCWFSKDKASDELRPRKTKAQRECDLWLQSSVVSPAQSDHGHWGRWLQPGVTRGSQGTSCPRLSEMISPPPPAANPVPSVIHPANGDRGTGLDLGAVRSAVNDTQTPLPSCHLPAGGRRGRRGPRKRIREKITTGRGLGRASQ